MINFMMFVFVTLKVKTYFVCIHFLCENTFVLMSYLGVLFLKDPCNSTTFSSFHKTKVNWLQKWKNVGHIQDTAQLYDHVTKSWKYLFVTYVMIQSQQWQSNWFLSGEEALEDYKPMSAIDPAKITV